MSVPCSIVFVTVPDAKTADSLSATLLEARAAACVNQVPGIRSSYWWEGKIERSEEILLVIKTRTASLEALQKLVRKNHPYSVPEIVGFPIVDGNKAYLDWIGSVTAPPAAAKR